MAGNGRCQTCKHWFLDREDNYIAPGGYYYGTRCCHAAKMLFNSTEWTPNYKGEGPDRKMKAGLEKVTAFVQDGSDYMAWLYTKPEHGCTMHEERTETDKKDFEDDDENS